MLVIRLQRTGRRNSPAYRLVVAEKSRAVQGKYLEILGHYLPTRNPSEFACNTEAVEAWIKKGAQPTDTAARLMLKAGVKNLEKFTKTYSIKKKRNAPEEEEAPTPPPPAPEPVAEESKAEPKEEVAAEEPKAETPAEPEKVEETKEEAPVEETKEDSATEPKVEAPTEEKKPEEGEKEVKNEDKTEESEESSKKEGDS